MQKALILTHSVESCHNSFVLRPSQHPVFAEDSGRAWEWGHGHNTPERFIMCENWEPRNPSYIALQTTPELVEVWLFPGLPHNQMHCKQAKLDGGKKGELELRLTFFFLFFFFLDIPSGLGTTESEQHFQKVPGLEFQLHRDPLRFLFFP